MDLFGTEKSKVHSPRLKFKSCMRLELQQKTCRSLAKIVSEQLRDGTEICIKLPFLVSAKSNIEQLKWTGRGSQADHILMPTANETRSDMWAAEAVAARNWGLSRWNFVTSTCSAFQVPRLTCFCKSKSKWDGELCDKQLLWQHLDRTTWLFKTMVYTEGEGLQLCVCICV